jgi:methionyl-tRNA synthetase
LKKNYYITTAIAYASDTPHIGNVYEVILADAIARFKRLDGYNVLFQTGTDEHGLKIEKAAKKRNIKSQIYVDQVSKTLKVFTIQLIFPMIIL